MIDRTYNRETVVLSRCVDAKMTCDICKQVKIYSRDGAIRYYNIHFCSHNEEWEREDYDCCCPECVSKWIEKNLDEIDTNCISIYNEYLSAN